MIHILLLILCIFSVELFIKSNFFPILGVLTKTTKRVIHVATSKYISDHWKEKILVEYALRIMKYSLQILSILLLVIFMFLIVNFFYNDLQYLLLSLIGIIESILFSLGYLFLKRSISK